MLLSYSRLCEITPFVKSCFYFNFWKMLCSVRLCVTVAQSDSTSLKLVPIGESPYAHYYYSPLLWLCVCLLLFPRYRLTIFFPENLHSFAVSTLLSLVWSHRKSFLLLSMVWKLVLKNYSPWVARWWTPHEQFWRITTVCWIDRQTAGRHAACNYGAL